MFSMAFCTSGKPILPSVTICEISARVLPSCVASSPARSMPRLWNCITSRVYSRPCTAVVPYNQVRSCRFKPNPAATLPNRVSTSVTSSAAKPYARSWRAPLATPCKSKGVLAANSTICDINASAFSLLCNRVVKATSSCWNSPLVRAICLTKPASDTPAPICPSVKASRFIAISIRSASVTTLEVTFLAVF